MIIVVSPLNALMDDQVRFLSGKGISSVALGGRENHSDHNTICEGITQGHYPRPCGRRVQYLVCVCVCLSVCLLPQNCNYLKI